MKIIRSLWSIVMLFPTAGFFFAGCYTHMETVRDGGPGGGDGDYYAYTDSTNASNDTTGANYFSDDDYRESNYRASFDYYAPPAYIWGSNICYDPWYDDCWYPGSYWYGYYPYWGFGYGYGYGSYYGGGYGYRGYRGGNYYAGRTRTIGTTRGGYGLLGGRSPAGSPRGIPLASGAASTRTRTQNAPQVAAATTSQSRSRQEVAWWERGRMATENSSERSSATVRSQSARGSSSIVYQRRNTSNPSRNLANARQVNQHRGRMQPARVGSGGFQSRQTAHQGYSHYSSPQGSSGRSGSSGGGSRSSGGGKGR